MRIVVAGAVSTTRLTLEGLVRHGASVVGVLQLRPESARSVTGFTPLDDVARRAGIPCCTFRNINDSVTVDQVRRWQPDVMFVAGLSQIVSPELLALPRLGTVGFHPTMLPSGRGRAPIAWLTLDGLPGAATFFQMDEGMDSGPVFVQEPFAVRPEDYAANVVERLEAATVAALDRWLPELLAGVWNPRLQDEVLATWNGRRTPADGLIDWSDPADEIHALIRATSQPHPGAYAWLGDRRLIIWRAGIEQQLPWRGVPGRILLTDPERGALVQAGVGLLWLEQVQFDDEPQPAHASQVLKVGARMNYVVHDELASLRARVAWLEEAVAGELRGKS